MTQQIADTLYYEENEYFLYSDIIDKYLDETNSEVEFGMTSTANYKGYTSNFKIVDGKLYVKDFFGYIKGDLPRKIFSDGEYEYDEYNIDKNYIFPKDKFQDGLVFADWYCGKLEFNDADASTGNSNRKFEIFIDYGVVAAISEYDEDYSDDSYNGEIYNYNPYDEPGENYTVSETAEWNLITKLAKHAYLLEDKNKYELIFLAKKYEEFKDSLNGKSYLEKISIFNSVLNSFDQHLAEYNENQGFKGYLDIYAAPVNELLDPKKSLFNNNFLSVGDVYVPSDKMYFQGDLENGINNYDHEINLVMGENPYINLKFGHANGLPRPEKDYNKALTHIKFLKALYYKNDSNISVGIIDGGVSCVIQCGQLFDLYESKIKSQFGTNLKKKETILKLYFVDDQFIEFRLGNRQRNTQNEFMRNLLHNEKSWKRKLFNNKEYPSLNFGIEVAECSMSNSNYNLERVSDNWGLNPYSAKVYLSNDAANRKVPFDRVSESCNCIFLKVKGSLQIHKIEILNNTNELKWHYQVPDEFINSDPLY
jgi:hypothetical protein